jgi:hypothetical protein
MKILLLPISCVLSGALLCAGESALTRTGLILDLDADKDVKVENGAVVSWKNQAEFKARDFEGRRVDGRPTVREKVEALSGHNALIFKKQELVNYDEDAFDHLTTGNGYTWFAVIAPYKQKPGLKDVNSFFGNLKNGGMYEGFWGCFNDDNSVWIGSRNSTNFGRWNADNPKVDGPKLEENRFYIVAGRMGSGTGEVSIELFVNDAKPAASKPFPVNPKANASKMAIGQERDATNHPGVESFIGEIARFLIYERPLKDEELAATLDTLKKEYGIK